MRRAVIIDAVRTPIGRAHPEKGIYRDVRADDLSADLMNALIERTGVPASEIEDIQWGCVKQSGEQGYDVARIAALIRLTFGTISRATGTSTGAPGSMKPFCRSTMMCAVRRRSSRWLARSRLGRGRRSQGIRHPATNPFQPQLYVGRGAGV